MRIVSDFTPYPVVPEAIELNFRRKPTSPASFRPGDLVEVHLSLALFVKDARLEKKLFPKVILRAVIGLDSTFTRVSYMTRA